MYVRQGIVKRIFDFATQNSWIYLVSGLFLGLLIYPLFQLIESDLNEFLLSLVPEVVGIVFTVFIIDRLDRNREYRLIREQLIRKMQSRDNQTALQAVEELRVMHHLMDGTLRGKDLRGAALRDCNLYQADLRDADLINADLYNADLYEAKLAGAKISVEQLISTKTMRWAVMPDGSKYDGRYNLYHDFAVMERKEFDPTDHESCAKYYDVPLNNYLEGQRWYQENHALVQRYAVREEDRG